MHVLKREIKIKNKPQDSIRGWLENRNGNCCQLVFIIVYKGPSLFIFLVAIKKLETCQSSRTMLFGNK
jgi:hypothetical protein